MNRKTSNIIIINSQDNVGVARVEIKPGEEIYLPNGDLFRSLQNIPAGHKIALQDIPAGAAVIKYGETIGKAKEEIKQGSWVHTHNLG